MMKKGARRLTVDALFAAVALTIFVIELYIPSVSIPGVKLGLANIVTVTAAFLIGPWDAGAILLTEDGRILVTEGLERTFSPVGDWQAAPVTVIRHGEN